MLFLLGSKNLIIIFIFIYFSKFMLFLFIINNIIIIIIFIMFLLVCKN